MDVPGDFEQYSGAYYSSKRDDAHRWVDSKTLVPFLERYLLKVMWLQETEQIPFPENDAGREAAKELVVKLIQEGRSLVACARDGSVYGALHHARGALEASAVAFYLFGKADETVKHLERWHQYREVYRYAHRQRLEGQLKEGEITKDEFDAACLVPPTAARVDASRVEAWIALYAPPKKDLLRLERWMGRDKKNKEYTYRRLLNDMDASRSDPVFTIRLLRY